MKQPLVILTGPTAVGKSDLSIKLAKQINGEIISADSMQVYRGMDIGSAKIRPEEMQGIRHYLIDELDPKEPFHVVKFQELAKKYIAENCTGFYIQAVLYDIDFTENGEDDSYRRELERIAVEKGADFLHQMLITVDPQAAMQIHANNIKRVIRALEFYHETGTQISQHNEQERQKVSPYNAAYFVLNDDRSAIYQRINRRVDLMMEAGLVEEVERLRKSGCTRDMVSMQGLGYKEILDYLEGICPLEEAVYTIKRDTRHFAKRQLTWFKRERDVIWVQRDVWEQNENAMLEFMLRTLEEKNIKI